MTSFKKLRASIPSVILACSICISVQPSHSDDGNSPPFGSAIHVSRSILTEFDPTALKELTYKGEGTRSMFDRRSDAFENTKAYLFDASYIDGLEIDVQVNVEFASPLKAELQANKYASAVGRLPAFLRADVETLWIHKGYGPFGGGNNNILIHVDYAEEDAPYLEESLIHEATHTSIDRHHKNMKSWHDAQKADGMFVSTYARDNPEREDLAESLIMFLAVEYMPERLTQSVLKLVKDTIPNRIEYFRSMEFDGLCPIVIEECPEGSAVGQTSWS